MQNKCIIKENMRNVAIAFVFKCKLISKRLYNYNNFHCVMILILINDMTHSLQNWQVHQRFASEHCGLSSWVSFQRLGQSQQPDICQVTHPQRWHHGGVCGPWYVCLLFYEGQRQKMLLKWTEQFESFSHKERYISVLCNCNSAKNMHM